MMPYQGWVRGFNLALSLRDNRHRSWLQVTNIAELVKLEIEVCNEILGVVVEFDLWKIILRP